MRMKQIVALDESKIEPTQLRDFAQFVFNLNESKNFAIPNEVWSTILLNQRRIQPTIPGPSIVTNVSLALRGIQFTEPIASQKKLLGDLLGKLQADTEPALEAWLRSIDDQTNFNEITWARQVVSTRDLDWDIKRKIDPQSDFRPTTLHGLEPYRIVSGTFSSNR